jgi:hypothetical protein
MTVYEHIFSLANILLLTARAAHKDRSIRKLPFTKVYLHFGMRTYKPEERQMDLSITNQHCFSTTFFCV